MLLNYRGNYAIVLGVHLIGRVKVPQLYEGLGEQKLLLIEKCMSMVVSNV